MLAVLHPLIAINTNEKKAEELRAGINHAVLNVRERREAKDWYSFSQMRRTTEQTLSGEQPAGDTPQPEMKQE